jgi:hypothetical protein
LVCLKYFGIRDFGIKTTVVQVQDQKKTFFGFIQRKFKFNKKVFKTSVRKKFFLNNSILKRFRNDSQKLKGPIKEEEVKRKKKQTKNQGYLNKKRSKTINPNYRISSWQA